MTIEHTLTNLVILDFDGTIFDTREAIQHAAALTFTTLLPGYEIPYTKARQLMATGAGLPETFRALQPDPTIFDEEKWVATYRSLYAMHEEKFTNPFPGLRELLAGLHSRGIPIAIVSNKAVPPIRTALERTGLAEFVNEMLIIGDGTPGSKRKPDAASFTEALVPRLKAVYGEGFEVDPGRVLMVGDTITDLVYARNIGARGCWCRFGQGDKEECESFRPDYAVDSLAEVLEIAVKE
ncbi:pyrophosphatase PpaX [Aspergillus udagawae]|uniref:Pyrophosphatase PpaX n=1 Tax=Aspergillus udagawae TaxID=91492 RepID=A0A8H3NDP3_9EURO|nr:pyrophosphatase PpaX [Aspergillus udagawae]